MKEVYENIKPVLALIAIILGFAFLFTVIIIFRNEPQLVGIALGAVIAMTGVAMQYYFGSSQGLAKANETIANNASNSTTQNVEEINTDAINVKK